MHIDSSNIDNLVYACSQKRALDGASIDGFSLGAAAEFATWVSHNASAEPFFRALMPKHWFLSESWRLLQGGHPVLPLKPYERVHEAFFPVRSAGIFGHLEWNQFLERFAAALKANGFVNGLHQALAGSLHEMADNIIQHSALGTAQAANGFVAYQVSDRAFSFTVADVGIGALRSLQDNPKYADLQNGRAALDLIARDKASRRGTNLPGGGYSELFVSLASLNGHVRLRSVDGVFSMTGALDRCSPSSASLHFVPGLQMSVECKI